MSKDNRHRHEDAWTNLLGAENIHLIGIRSGDERATWWLQFVSEELSDWLMEIVVFESKFLINLV